MTSAIYSAGLAVVLMAAVVGLYPGSAGAVVVGLSDQEPAALGDPLFTALGMHQARLIVPWDAASQDPARVDAWLTAARDAQLTPLVTFEHAATDRCPAAPCRMPSTAEFRAAFEAFRARWPWVTTFGTWNEANHQTQPTMGRPAATGLLYNALVSACRECTVLAVEVLDEQNMTSWLQTFREFAHEPRLWGLHNYRDVTYGRSDGTQAMLRAVPGDIWVTETGGITYQRTASGVVSQPFDPERAARAIHNAFALARAAAGRISRLYVYNWIAEAGDRFDAGLLAPDASLRPSYYALVDELRAQASGAHRPRKRSCWSLRCRVRLRVARTVYLDAARRVHVRIICSSQEACRGRMRVIAQARSKRGRLRALWSSIASVRVPAMTAQVLITAPSKRRGLPRTLRLLADVRIRIQHGPTLRVTRALREQGLTARP